MGAPKYFEAAEGYAVLRPTGALLLNEVMDMITCAISFARDEGVSRLLVVLTGVAGLKPPRLAVRYGFIREWARVSGGLVRLAVVTATELMEPDRFGVIVAANAGMITDVFDDEKAALAWLLSAQ